MDQGVKFIEDMQDDFDFRYKTLQSRGEAFHNIKHCHFLLLCSNLQSLCTVLWCVYGYVCHRSSREELRPDETGSHKATGNTQQT